MLATRISILSFYFSLLLFSFSSLSECSYTHADHANEWILLYAEQMDPEQLQLTANFLHLLHANAFIDTKIQSAHYSFSLLYQKARANLCDIRNSNAELQQLQNLSEKLLFLAKIRLVYTDLLDDCINYCNEQGIDIVTESLRALETYASTSLYSWTHEHHQQFASYLEKSSKLIADCEQSLHFASGLHKGLSNGETPFVVHENEKPLAIMNTVLKTAPAFMHTADMVINTFNDICDDAMKIICLGTEIYHQHYKALYDLMDQDSFDPAYKTTMFSQHVLPLPQANHLFEHMIETTKLTYELNSME